MKITDIYYDSDIKITDFENFFDVVNVDGMYKYNLNNTMYLDIAED